VQAAQKAINSPLLEASMDGAHGVLLSIAGGSDLGLFEINEAASLVQEAAHEDANIIFGTVIDDSLGDEVRVTVIAAGFDSTPSVLPPSIDQRARAATSTGSGPGPNGNGFSQAASRVGAVMRPPNMRGVAVARPVAEDRTPWWRT
jgi:cell division protein FtsZ